MTRAAGWAVKRCRTRLDVLAMFGIGYVLGAGAWGTWWGRIAIIACAMGVTDIAATALRRLAGRSPEMTGDEGP